MAHYTIVQGTTTAIQFQLLEAGAPINLAASSISLLLSDKHGNAISSPGTASITSGSEGKVQLLPSSSTVFDATKSPYLARWVITTAGLVSYAPSGPRDVWEIVGA